MENTDFDLELKSEDFGHFDLEYERHRQSREDELKRRRAQKKREQEKKRKRAVIIIISIIAMLLILLIALTVRAISRAVARHREFVETGQVASELEIGDIVIEAIDDMTDSITGTGDTDSASLSDTDGKGGDSGDGILDGKIDDNALVGGYHLEKPADFLGKNTSASGSTITVGDNILIKQGYAFDFSDIETSFAEDGVYSTYGLLIDLDTLKVIGSRDGRARIYPASMTKIMTLLVAAEHITEDNLNDKVSITIDETDYVFKYDLSAVNFDEGETVTVRDLFYGTILPSGGDAALALAKYIAGDEETFVKLMNEKVSELGLSDSTHFKNCVGLYDDDNYSTCEDIAVILKAAVENTFCYDVLNAHWYTTLQTPEHPDGIEISNLFLRRIEDHYLSGEVLCAKTGFVKQSGCCAASFTLTDTGHPYIFVSGDAWSSWRCIFDHVYAYENYVR